MLCGQPESKKLPWKAAATKDAAALFFKQCLEFVGRNFRSQPQSEHPSCRCAANQIKVRSDRTTQRGFEFGENRGGVQAAITAP